MQISGKHCCKQCYPRSADHLSAVRCQFLMSAGVMGCDFCSGAEPVKYDSSWADIPPWYHICPSAQLPPECMSQSEQHPQHVRHEQIMRDSFDPRVHHDKMCRKF